MLHRIHRWCTSDPKRERQLKIFLFVLPFVIVAGLLMMKFVTPGYYFRFAIREDGLAEYLTAFCFLLASIFFLLSWRAADFLGNRLLSFGFLAAGVLLFLAFGEEISWGQRILDIQTPAGMAEANRQGEITLHNLNAVQGRLIYIALSTSFLGAFGWVIFGLLPVRARDRLVEVGVRRLIPDWFLSSYFLVLFVVFSAMTYLQRPLIAIFGDALRKGGAYFVSGDQEPVEAIFALGVLLFALFSYANLKREAASRD
jgi:hypothetical protein